MFERENNQPLNVILWGMLITWCLFPPDDSTKQNKGREKDLSSVEERADWEQVTHLAKSFTMQLREVMDSSLKSSQNMSMPHSVGKLRCSLD